MRRFSHLLVVKKKLTIFLAAATAMLCLHLAVFSQALSLVEEGSEGLSARHRAIVHHAVSVGHPWVSAIYDECKETGDVRGLMVREWEGKRGFLPAHT